MEDITIDDGSSILTGRKHIQISVGDKNGSWELKTTVRISERYCRSQAEIPKHRPFRFRLKIQSTCTCRIDYVGKIINCHSTIRFQINIDQDGFAIQIWMEDELGRLRKGSLAELEDLNTIIVPLRQGDRAVLGTYFNNRDNTVGSPARPVRRFRLKLVEQIVPRLLVHDNLLE